MATPSWMERAACADEDTGLFFPSAGRRPEGGLPGIAVCKGCEVCVECLDYALAEDIAYGIWGGLTQDERYRLAVARSEPRTDAPHGTVARYASKRLACRCDQCRAAVRKYQTGRRRRPA